MYFQLRVILGAMIKVAPSWPQCHGFEIRNNLSAHGGKAAYIQPSPNPAVEGTLCTGLSFSITDFQLTNK